MNYKIIKGFDCDFKNKKEKIFFFHVPKTAGVSVVSSLNVSMKNFRIMGPWKPYHKIIENNENYKSDFLNKFPLYNNSKINMLNYCTNAHYELTKKYFEDFQFVSGHLPFKNFSNIENRFTFTMLRDPVKRSISNYNFWLEKKFICPSQSLEELFEKKILTQNLMTCFFSSFNDPNVEVALKNLKNIDLVTDVSMVEQLLSYIISYFNLPNIIFTNKNVTKFKKSISNDNLKIFKKYNELDIEFYEQSKKNWFDYNYFKKKPRICDIYSMHNSQFLINNNENNIFKSDFLNKILPVLNNL